MSEHPLIEKHLSESDFKIIQQMCNIGDFPREHPPHVALLIAKFFERKEQSNEVTESKEEHSVSQSVMPCFEINFTFIDRTDASIHKETIQAETSEEALNELHRKHNYKIEWRTIKEINKA